MSAFSEERDPAYQCASMAFNLEVATLMIVQTALSHVSGGGVELSYRRTDYLEQPRVM